jgi:DNA repair exonuclease SbcCD nuclease subunit
MNLVLRVDAHLADDAPVSRTDDWASTILGKVVQVGQIATEVEAVGVLDTGDFFHIKSPSRNSHELVVRAAEAHKGYPCPVWSTIGNHDCKYGSAEFLKEGPLGVLFETGVFQRLYDKHEARFHEPCMVPDNPTDPKGTTFTVRVVGVPYHGTSYDMNRLTTITKGDEDYLVVVAHLLASPTQSSMYEAEDVLRYSDLANLDPDVWCFGHWHKNQGVQVVGGKTFVNIGSISRGALTQDDLNRQPCVAVLHFDKKGVTVKTVPLRVAPAEEVFDVSGRDRKVARAANVDNLVENIKTILTQRQTGDLLEEVRSMPGLTEPVRERSLFYLERARG